ncbi:MAG: ral secretion pathway protein [Betaproteobacteria bacterium]|jgi:general secretion pathway protein D|nr:ral secretion pathway protein [Betaproteobacteria bacterium]
MKKIILIALLSLAACATHDKFQENRGLIEAGNVDEGLARIAEQVKQNPNDVELRNYYLRHRALAVQNYLAMGDNALGSAQLDAAAASYNRALGLEADNARAKAGLQTIDAARKHQLALGEAEAALKAGNSKQAAARLREVLKENPRHREANAMLRRIEEQEVKAEAAAPELTAALKKPITLEFRDAPLRSVFELISKQTGLNFIFDKDVGPEVKTTVFVRNTSIEDVIRFVLVTNQLERKVLNDNTVLIYPNTPAKARDYKDLVVRSFYLANADVKQTATMVRQLVKTRDLFVDEKLNLLVVRDTPEAIRIVEKLIASQDLAEPEVMLEVEVIEVSHSTLTQLGIQWPGQVAAGIIGAGGVPGQITGKELLAFNSGLVRITASDPLLALNLRQQAGRTNVLANPRIRAKSREKARIHIGDKVPVITTTAGATGFVSESITYLEVGLKLEVEPQVYLDNDVGIKVGLEVSNVGQQTKTSSGTIAYTVGTRNTATTLRLRDGETQVLAGLISDEDRRNASQVPGLSKMPVLGRLFKSTDDNITKTEIVLLMTPRVVRNIERPSARIEHFVSGTDAEVGGAGLALPPLQPAPVPSQPAQPAPVPSQAPQVVPALPPAAGPQPARPQ